MNIFRRIVSRLKKPSASGNGNLFRIMNMAWIGQSVYVATELGIPDQLDRGPKSTDQLANLTGTPPYLMKQLMRALAGFEIFLRDEKDNYRLTAMSEQLVERRNSWMRHYILLWGQQLYPACGQMLGMMKTGHTAYELAHGQSLYEHYRSDREAGERFVDFMNAVTEWQRDIIVAAIDFGSYRHVLDVGGGRAGLLTHILKANPDLKGTILDQPHMKELVSTRIREAGLDGRCIFASGNFLKEVDAGADLYIIKHVLHDWPDDDVVTILRNIRAAMPDKSELIIIEGVMNDSNGVDRLVKMRDIEQMVWTGGSVRTRKEFASLTGRAGLRLLEVKHTAVIDTCLLKCVRSQDDGE